MIEFLLYILAMVMTPGPNVILCMANASKYGFKKTLPLMFGCSSGITVISCAVYFLISYLVSLVAKLSTVLQILGIVYMLFLAFSFLSKNGIAKPKEGNGFKRGFVLQFLNVKLLLLLVTSTANFIIPMGKGTMEGFIISLILPIMCFMSQIVWGAAGLAISRWYEKYQKFFNVLFCLMLAGLAIKNLVILVNNLV